MITIRSENCTVRSGIKEVIFVTSGVGPVSKSTRISELPSLRYGPVGPKTNITGPLVLRRDGIKGRKSEQLIRLPRKVRFALPAPEGVRGVEDSENAASLENSEGILLFDVNTQKAFSQRPGAKQSETEKASLGAASVDKFSLPRRFDKFRKERLQDRRRDFEERVEVPVSVSPGIRHRVHPTGRYIRGTLSPTSNQAPHESPLSPGGQVLLRAARDGDDNALREQLRRALTMGLTENDLNATDSSGRTILSHVASNGTIDVLELLLQVPGLDPNKPDNEGNTPLHFAAQAGQVECLNFLASRCRGVEIDARNNLGFTPLMKAALQGRNKCAKLLLFAGANPTLRDNGRGFRADQWARFCGRYVCADVIEKHARQRLLERSTSYGNWGMENDTSRVVMGGKVLPIPPISSPPSNGLKSKLKKVFRTSSGPSSDTFSSARLVTQLTSAALCASSPVLPGTGSVPPMVKSLLRPLTVPRLQITLVNNNGDHPNNNLQHCEGDNDKEGGAGRPIRGKKKK
ncbi:ankyrin repeat family A protein 2-like isoform X1 [Euwallacea fornicatus]|uniref:ankyrin repeat family A protein 2-like isoform X1 n=1 Tax=Euwallacea fornicatus TaxID=995702 RepID=UPI00338FDCCD